MTVTGTAVGYNPFAPDFYTSDPFAVYRWMRDEAPLFRSEQWGWWALSRFDDVRAAILDPDTFRSFEGMDIDDSALEQAPPGSLPNMDNPRHDEIRRIVQPYFLPRRVAELEDGIRAVVRDLVGSWRDRGAVDLAEDLAWPMPFDVFFHVMGLPSRRERDPEQLARRDQLERWTHELKDRVPGTPHLTPVARAATAGVQQYFIDLLEERRRQGGDDLVTHFVRSDVDGVPFVSEEVTPTSEVSGLMLVLYLGGVESTAGLTGNLFKLLAENPDQRALLQRDPTLIPAAIEEALRLHHPAAADRPHDLAGGHPARRDDPRRRAGGPGHRRREPRRAAVPGRRHVRHHPRSLPSPRFRRRRARLPGCAAGPPRGAHRAGGGAPRARRLRARRNADVLSQLAQHVRLEEATGHLPRGEAHLLRGRERTPTARRGGAAPDDERHAGHLGVRRRRPGSPPSMTVADGVVTLALRDVDDHPLPAWEPGAHVDLILDSAPTRQYSLCGDPADHHEYRLGILRDPDGRGGSRYVHDRLAAATSCACAARATTSRWSPRRATCSSRAGSASPRSCR